MLRSTSSSMLSPTSTLNRILATNVRHSLTRLNSTSALGQNIPSALQDSTPKPRAVPRASSFGDLDIPGRFTSNARNGGTAALSWLSDDEFEGTWSKRMFQRQKQIYPNSVSASTKATDLDPSTLALPYPTEEVDLKLSRTVPKQDIPIPQNGERRQNAQGNGERRQNAQGNGERRQTTQGNGERWQSGRGNRESWQNGQGNRESWQNGQGNRERWQNEQGNKERNQGNQRTWTMDGQGKVEQRDQRSNNEAGRNQFRDSRPRRDGERTRHAGRNQASDGRQKEENAPQQTTSAKAKVDATKGNSKSQLPATVDSMNTDLDHLFSVPSHSFSADLITGDVASPHGLRLQHIRETFGGDYARYLPPDLGVVTAKSSELGPVARAQLAMAHNRDVNLIRRQNALKLISQHVQPAAQARVPQ